MNSNNDNQRLTAVREILEGVDPSMALQDCAQLFSGDEQERLRSIHDLDRRLVAHGQKAQRDIDQRVSRLTDYVVDQVESESRSRKRSAWPFLARMKQNAGEMHQSFWGWVIYQFNLIDYDRVRAPRRANREPATGLYLRWAALCLIILLPLALILYHDPVDDGAARIVTESTNDQPILLKYTEQVQVALAPRTTIDRLSDTKIALNQGEVWLDVEKGGDGFEVETEYGLVTVLGTQFGVRILADGRARLDVIEGRVRLNQGPVARYIDAGQYVLFEQDSIGDTLDRENNTQVAVWLQNLYREQAIREISGLVLHYPMVYDGQVQDGGYFNIDGRLAGARQVAFDADSVDGNLFERAARFDKVNNSWIELPEHELLNCTTHPQYTMMGWLCLGSAPTPENRFWSTKTLSSGFTVGMNRLQEGGVRLVVFYLSGEPKKIDIPDFPVGQWAHLAVGLDNTNGALHVSLNGESLATVEFEPRDVSPAPQQWLLGRNRIRPDSEYQEHYNIYYDGMMDDFRVYNRILRQDEIRQISKIDLITVNNP